MAIPTEPTDTRPDLTWDEVFTEALKLADQGWTLRGRLAHQAVASGADPWGYAQANHLTVAQYGRLITGAPF